MTSCAAKRVSEADTATSTFEQTLGQREAVEMSTPTRARDTVGCSGTGAAFGAMLGCQKIGTRYAQADQEGSASCGKGCLQEARAQNSNTSSNDRDLANRDAGHAVARRRQRPGHPQPAATLNFDSGACAVISLDEMT